MNNSIFYVYLLGIALMILTWYIANRFLRKREKRLSMDDAEKLFVLLIAILLVVVAFFVN